MTFRYGTSDRPAVKDVSFTLAKGEVLGIVGESGCGKTTVGRSIVRLAKPHRGVACLDCHSNGHTNGATHLVGDIRRPHSKHQIAEVRAKLGMVFQSYHLLDDLTVQENIDLPLSYKDIPRGQRQSLVADTLDRFQIVAKKDLYPSQLSGGQQQLVGIARAVIHKPSLLLADEPTGNLHSGQAKEIMELFRDLNQQGTTIVQVTHSEANAAYGNRTIQLRDGWLIGDTANPALTQPTEVSAS